MARGDARDRDDRDDDRDTRRDYHKSLGVVDDEMMAYYKKQLKEAQTRSGSKTEFIDTLPEGTTYLRVLPSLKKKKPWFKFTGQHWGFGEKGKTPVYCPKLCVAKDEDCPICDFVEMLKKSKKESDLKKAEQYVVKPRWMAQVLDRDADDDKPKLWGFGTQIYQGIMTLITEQYPDLMKLDDGYDIGVKRKGLKMNNTEYSVFAEREPSVVDVSITDIMLDLDDYIEKRLFSPKEMEQILDGADPMDIAKERGVEADEDETPRRSARSSDRDRDDRDDRRSPARDRESSRDDERPRRARDDDDRPSRSPRDDDDDRPRSRADRDDRDRDDRSRDRDDRPLRDREPERASRARDDDDRGRGRDDDRDDRGRDRGRDRDRTPARDDRDDRHASGARGSAREDEKPRRPKDDDYDDEAEREMAKLRGAAGGRDDKDDDRGRRARH